MRLFPVYVDCKTGHVSFGCSKVGCWHCISFTEKKTRKELEKFKNKGQNMRMHFVKLHKMIKEDLKNSKV